MYEREEVNDEIQGLAAQEIAKIKHMVMSSLMNVELVWLVFTNDLTRCKSGLG